jgi:SWI/SNF-related matrix-associated actin-dependent regulator 1 of chromatin subfamily A
MKPFQLVGLNWMSLLYKFKIGCILADEMGLGKTCQVISLICHLVQDYEESKGGRGTRPWPNLIVVPPSTYNNWLGEFQKFAPDLSVIGYRGSQAERAEIAYEIEHDPEAFHVVLATYSQINNDADIEAMQSIGMHTAIFDEGHKMKNPETKIYKDLRRIHASWKMLLTGMLPLVLSWALLLMLYRNSCSEQFVGDDLTPQFHKPRHLQWLHATHSVHL